MKVMVLLPAAWPTEAEARKKLWIMLESCKKFGIEPHLFGIGTPQFPLWVEMLVRIQVEYLKANRADYTHVLYTHAQDAFFVAPLDEIIEKYKAMGSPQILASASHQFANVSNEEADYPECFTSPERYRYLHIGGRMGEMDAMIETLERMLTLPRQTSDDCFSHYDSWQEGWYRPTLDSGCQIFQTHAVDCAVEKHRVLNTHTGTMPCILHISGGYSSQVYGKDDSVIPWAVRLGILPEGTPIPEVA